MGEGVRGDDLDVLTCEKDCASMTTLRVPDSGVVVFWLGGSGGGRGGDEMRRIGELLQQDAHTCAHGIAGQRKKFSVERIASPCTFGQGDKKKIKIVEKKKKTHRANAAHGYRGSMPTSGLRQMPPPPQKTRHRRRSMKLPSYGLAVAARQRWRLAPGAAGRRRRCCCCWRYLS